MKYESNENKKASETKKPIALSGEAVVLRQQPFWSHIHHRLNASPAFAEKHEQGPLWAGWRRC